MVVTATNIKTPALPQQIDINGTAIATPAGASGIVGKLNGQDFFVVRNGQTISLQSGDWLTDGDRVVTSSAAAYSTETSHLFRLKPASHSTRNRPPIPWQTSHP
jgi:hypothetical protein